MSRLIAIGMLLLLLCGACQDENRDVTLYQKNGRTKPIVAVLPVINSNEGGRELSWDLARELTEGIRKRALGSSKLYLLRENGSLDMAHQLNTPDLKRLQEMSSPKLGSAEFIVISELVDEKEIPYGVARGMPSNPQVEEIGAVLSVSMRVRVLDIREPTPRVILQEVIHHEHVIDRGAVGTNYTRSSYGTEAYRRTPLGLAHSKLIRELVARVEGYIGANKG